VVQGVLAARGALSEDAKRRLDRIEAIFDVKVEKPAKSDVLASRVPTAPAKTLDAPQKGDPTHA
jgi:hypothetical protein